MHHHLYYLGGHPTIRGSQLSSRRSPSRVTFLVVMALALYALMVFYSKKESLTVPSQEESGPNGAPWSAPKLKDATGGGGAGGANMDGGPFLLIAIPTSASAEESAYRATIRSSWAQTLPLGTVLRFFVGIKNQPATAEALRAEAAQTADIVFLEDVEESYTGLSSKMMYIHAWIAQNQPNVRWVFKTDTDVWVNARDLVSLASTYNPASKTAVGYRYVDNIRMLKGKWANPGYSSSVYPQYMAGAGYLLSGDITRWVARNFLDGWLKSMPNEDALLGIWLAGTPVTWDHSPRFLPLIDAKHPSRITNLDDESCRDDGLLFHHMTPEGIKVLDGLYRECGSPCLKTCEAKRAEARHNDK
ncbi:Beta-1,3-N-acetylgalactosaminyltransferase 2 [Cladochytrium tenue]|nr:Beta-1,3-N-acetylgalactosaminyltransferase 2 [Cladochytrium tenue]